MVIAAVVVLLFLALLVQMFGPWSRTGQQQAAVAEQPQADANTGATPIYATLQLKDGPVKIELMPSVAPKAAERLKTLISQGFYDGVVFHRVIAGFMAQTGDPTGTGTGGSDLPDLPAEFSSVPFERGVIGMARAQDPNSANSQFFIMFAQAPSLNGQYTVVGKVVSGMEYVDMIKKGDPAANGMVPNPDKIISFKLDNGA